MAGCACNRPIGIAGPLVFFMALDALQVHHLFGFDFPFGFHRLDGIGFLGKNAMAYVAVFKLVLVLSMGKGYLAAAAAVNVDMARSIVGG